MKSIDKSAASTLTLYTLSYWNGIVSDLSDFDYLCSYDLTAGQKCVYIIIIITGNAFSALTLLVGDQDRASGLQKVECTADAVCDMSV